jgi:hypothetical protein
MTLRILSGIGIRLILRRDERCSAVRQWDSSKELSAVSFQPLSVLRSGQGWRRYHVRKAPKQTGYPIDFFAAGQIS